MLLRSVDSITTRRVSFEVARIASNFRFYLEITIDNPRTRSVQYKPEAQASESKIRAIIHSLALRACSSATSKRVSEEVSIRRVSTCLGTCISISVGVPKGLCVQVSCDASTPMSSAPEIENATVEKTE